MNRSSTFTITEYLLNDLADQAIVVEGHLFRQSGEFYVAVFEDFILTVDSTPILRFLRGTTEISEEP